MAPATLSRLRKRTCEVGPLEALERKPQTSPSRKKIVDGELEARITQIACSEAPGGRKRWTLRLIAERLVELELVDSISHETVRAAMKKKHQAMAEPVLVHPSQGQCQLRGGDGGYS